MRLRGGGDDDFDDEIIEEDGMFKLGDFLFHSKVCRTPPLHFSLMHTSLSPEGNSHFGAVQVDARRLTAEPFFTKEPGSMLWPLNWAKQVKSPQLGSLRRKEKGPV